MIRLLLPVSLAAFAALGIASGAVLYTNAGPLVANETGAGSNLPGLSLSRTSTATDTLYFKYTLVNPSSNSTNENYYAAMELYEGGAERLGIGNAWAAYAYSAFNAAGGASPDLNSANPETGQSYQLVRATDVTTVVFRVDYVNGGDDNVTVWLNPNLSLTEAAQNPLLKTTFTANSTFNEIHLREGGGTAGSIAGSWSYSNIAIASLGTDTGFFAPVPEPATAGLLGLVGGLGFIRRRRR